MLARPKESSPVLLGEKQETDAVFGAEYRSVFRYSLPNPMFGCLFRNCRGLEITSEQAEEPISSGSGYYLAELFFLNT